MYVLYCTIFTHEIMNVNSALNFAICKKLFCKICLLFIPVSYNCKAILYFIFQRHCKEVLYNILILQDEKLSLRQMFYNVYSRFIVKYIFEQLCFLIVSYNNLAEQLSLYTVGKIPLCLTAPMAIGEQCLIIYYIILYIVKTLLKSSSWSRSPIVESCFYHIITSQS